MQGFCSYLLKCNENLVSLSKWFDYTKNKCGWQTMTPARIGKAAEPNLVISSLFLSLQHTVSPVLPILCQTARSI